MVDFKEHLESVQAVVDSSVAIWIEFFTRRGIAVTSHPGLMELANKSAQVGNFVFIPAFEYDCAVDLSNEFGPGTRILTFSAAFLPFVPKTIFGSLVVDYGEDIVSNTLFTMGFESSMVNSIGSILGSTPLPEMPANFRCEIDEYKTITMVVGPFGVKPDGEPISVVAPPGGATGTPSILYFSE